MLINRQHKTGKESSKLTQKIFDGNKNNKIKQKKHTHK